MELINNMTNNLHAGCGREIITPAIGTLLFGYRPDVESTSVNDDLHVTALALANGDTRVLIITVEVCEVANDLVALMRQRIHDVTDIDEHHIIIAATHTHSGPNTVGIPGWGGLDEDYSYNILVPRTVAAAESAVNSLQPVKVGVGTTHSDIGINRREIDRHGNILLGQNPWGPYDPTLTVVSFRTLDDKPVFNMIHYCCHGTASGMNREISRDWSGPMIDRVESLTGAMTAFINGAEGDVGPRLSNGKTTGDIAYAMELGGLAAIDATRAYNTIKEWHTDANLRVCVGDISLPYKELPALDEVKSALAKYTNPESLVNVNYLEYNHWKNILELYENDAPRRTHLTFKQTLVAIGSVVIVPFPFEIFVEPTLRLRKYSPYPHTLCLSNANGAISYFPSQDQLCRGGYEVRTFIAADTYTLTDNADDNIINCNLDLMEELKCTE